MMWWILFCLFVRFVSNLNVGGFRCDFRIFSSSATSSGVISICVFFMFFVGNWFKWVKKCYV